MSFLKAFGATLGAVGFPVLMRVFFVAEGDAEGRIIMVLLVLGVAVFAGLAWAVRSLLLRWAYDRVTRGPF
ncbi:hypothetical protein G5B46_13545 [Caulobacter sp. 602-2]|uniref:Uncharacterized protein n=1 Tax=Caulobacter sp. 602-2 TaxID=2710887 RepID=A0A6G4QYB1_9CAUL|nr:hypothetical protein [Caulobacter sp. 602-2]NGM50636.1 hypothetical protein [Caulobacter sp. 602-2]